MNIPEIAQYAKTNGVTRGQLVEAGAMPQHHNLKSFNVHFQAIVDGAKRSEVRTNDRNYQVGDILTLHEGQYEKGEFEYTGRTVSAEISFIDTFGMVDNYVTLSLRRVGLIVI